MTEKYKVNLKSKNIFWALGLRFLILNITIMLFLPTLILKALCNFNSNPNSLFKTENQVK